MTAIDDVIARGRWQDWADLRRAALADRAVLERISRVCRARAQDRYAQRYAFWRRYAEEHAPSS